MDTSEAMTLLASVEKNLTMMAKMRELPKNSVPGIRGGTLNVYFYPVAKNAKGQSRDIKSPNGTVLRRINPYTVRRVVSQLEQHIEQLKNDFDRDSLQDHWKGKDLNAIATREKLLSAAEAFRFDDVLVKTPALFFSLKKIAEVMGYDELAARFALDLINSQYLLILDQDKKQRKHGPVLDLRGSGKKRLHPAGLIDELVAIDVKPYPDLLEIRDTLAQLLQIRKTTPWAERTQPPVRAVSRSPKPN